MHMAQLMPLPLTLSCFSKIQIGFTFLVPAHPGSPGQRAVKWVCVCVCVSDLLQITTMSLIGARFDHLTGQVPLQTNNDSALKIMGDFH